MMGPKGSNFQEAWKKDTCISHLSEVTWKLSTAIYLLKGKLSATYVSVFFLPPLSKWERVDECFLFVRNKFC